jgi:hypothetical protein
MSKLIDFYLGEGRDVAGRTIEELWQFKYGALEAGHDYIQFLFPTIQASNYNPDAPILSVEDIALFKANPKLKENLLISFDKILDFFGLRCANEGGTIVVRKGTNFIERKSVLFEGFNHNHLRVTRVIDCLNLLGLQEYAKAFFDFLSRQKQFFTENCFRHWEKAMRGGAVDQVRIDEDKALYENLRTLQNKLSRTPQEEGEMRKLIHRYYVENEDVRNYWKTR